MKRKYILAILFIVIITAFCGTATAEEQNNIQDTQSDTNPQTTVNDQATTSTVQDNSIVDTSSTSSTQNNIQDTQSDTNPQTTQNVASNAITNSYTANEDPVVITFDDGFESVYTIAFPIMEQYGIKGTVYITQAW